MNRTDSSACRVRGPALAAAGIACLLFFGLFDTGAATAATLKVGPGERFKAPSEAANAARDGDGIEIAPGEYFDCAFWRASNLTIAGTGPGVVITDKTCGGKALFVISGNDVTVRDLTLTRARVPDGNGAGIRAEGKNLTVTGVRFVNNQNGILAAAQPEGTIEIRDSEFVRNGTCASGKGCAHGVYVNALARLTVVHSRFFETRDGHHIKSRAARTEVIGNTIEDGDNGTSSYLIDAPNGGSVIVEGNTMQKGPKNSNHGTAISIGAEGVTQRTAEIIVRDNTFTNDYGGKTTFVNNITATEATLSGNVLKGKVTALKGDGEVR